MYSIVHLRPAVRWIGAKSAICRCLINDEDLIAAVTLFLMEVCSIIT